MKARAGFLAGLIAAALAALPAAWRFDASLRAQAFCVLFASAALVCAPFAAALSIAAPPGRLARAVTLGTIGSAVVLVPLGTMLKVSTHHRPLGGVTFACLAAAVICGSSLVSARLLTWAGEQPSFRRTLSRVAIVAFAALGAAAALLGLSRGLLPDAAFRRGFLDAMLVLAFSLLAARVKVPPVVVRRARGFGLATFIAVVTVGVCLGRAPSMQAELAARAPVLHWPLLWLGG